VFGSCLSIAKNTGLSIIGCVRFLEKTEIYDYGDLLWITMMKTFENVIVSI